eukprot:3430537-Amphidinium_carterae.1
MAETLESCCNTCCSQPNNNIIGCDGSRLQDVFAADSRVTAISKHWRSRSCNGHWILKVGQEDVQAT